MRSIEVKYVDDLVFITEWVDECSFEKLREKVNTFVEPYLTVASLIKPSIEGVHIEYLEIDADDFGNGNDVIAEVRKWKVRIKPKHEKGVTESILDDSNW